MEPANRFLRVLTGWAAALLGLAVTASLGIWQMQRADEKRLLQAQWDHVLQRQPVDWASAIPDHAAQQLPVRVRLSGQWLPHATVWLDNRTLDGQSGFWVVTPLRLAGPDAAVVLVLRGWVPRDPKDRLHVPTIATPQEPVIVEGVARAHLSALLDLGQGPPMGPLPAIWQNLDFAAFESASGLRVARWVLHQTQPNAAEPGLLRVPLRVAGHAQRHVGYAVQWFALCAVIAVFSLYFGWRTYRAHRKKL